MSLVDDIVGWSFRLKGPPVVASAPSGPPSAPLPLQIVLSIGHGFLNLEPLPSPSTSNCAH